MRVVVALWLLPYSAAGFLVSKQSVMNSENKLYGEEVFVIFNTLMIAEFKGELWFIELILPNSR